MNATPTPRQPDDRTELTARLPAPAQRELASGRHHQLREFVLREINGSMGRDRQPSARRRFAIATASGAAVALIVAGVVGTSVWLNRTAAPSQGQAQPGSVLTASVTYPAPRPDQWIYVKDVTVDTSAVNLDKGGSSDPQTREGWLRVDGTQMAAYNDVTGNLDTWDQTSDYPFLATLPTDPGAVLDAVRAYEAQLDQDRASLPSGATPPVLVDGADPTSDESLRGDIARFFQSYVLPPDVAASLWQALALLSGVTQEPAAVTFRGHTALAATWVDQGWQSVRFYVDPDTHAFVGSETTAIADYVFDTPTGPLTEKAGSALWSIERLAAGIVDEPGDTV